jgi:hypothetical protein
VVADVEAKRAIVDAYEGALGTEGPSAYREGPRTALRLLASVYANHADYREEWRN